MTNIPSQYLFREPNCDSSNQTVLVLCTRVREQNGSDTVFKLLNQFYLGEGEKILLKEK